MRKRRLSPRRIDPAEPAPGRDNNHVSANELPIKYAVAISFAGEDRKFSEAVAEELTSRGIKVFYDRYEQHDLWGKDLHETLQSIYTKECRYCLLVLSPDYLKKMWPIFERRQIIDRLRHEHGNDCVLPVRLNGFDGEVPGLSDGIGYLAAKSDNTTYIAKMLIRKIHTPGYELDSAQAFDRALTQVKKRRAGYVEISKVFTSADLLSAQYRSFVGVAWIHGLLGDCFYWVKEPNGPLRLLAENIYDKELAAKGMVEICWFDASEAWRGCGRWEICPPESFDAGDVEDSVELVLSLYLYSDDVADVTALREPSEVSVFLAGVVLRGHDVEEFYRLAEQRFRDLR